jgi:hypothetical protein
LTTGKGTLYLTGWVADTPDDNEAAYLLLTTPGDGDIPVSTGMLEVIEALGLGRPGSMTDAAHLTAVLTGDHVTISAGGILAERPTAPGWTRAARERGQIVLLVGIDPLPVDPSPDKVDRYTTPEGADRISFALVPTRVASI